MKKTLSLTMAFVMALGLFLFIPTMAKAAIVGTPLEFGKIYTQDDYKDSDSYDYYDFSCDKSGKVVITTDGITGSYGTNFFYELLNVNVGKSLGREDVPNGMKTVREFGVAPGKYRIKINNYSNTYNIKAEYYLGDAARKQISTVIGTPIEFDKDYTDADYMTYGSYDYFDFTSKAGNITITVSDVTGRYNNFQYDFLDLDACTEISSYHSVSNGATDKSTYTVSGGKYQIKTNNYGNAYKIKVSYSEVPKIAMYRLYNSTSGEHFYTKDANEKTYLATVAGWTYEGIGWYAPEISNTPVYRLCNPNNGDHHYTVDANEKDFLVAHGWTYEGIGWYSDDNKGVPLYRQFNPNVSAGSHNYTADKNENDYLVAHGWNGEGIGWYGLAV